MIRLYVLDVDDFRPIIRLAAETENVRVERHGNYAVITTDVPLVIDRRATGVRHAIWYSAVAGVTGGRITEQDKDALRVQPF